MQEPMKQFARFYLIVLFFGRVVEMGKPLEVKLLFDKDKILVCKA